MQKILKTWTDACALADRWTSQLVELEQYDSKVPLLKLVKQYCLALRSLLFDSQHRHANCDIPKA